MKVPASLALLIVAASGSTGAAAQYVWQAREAAQDVPAASEAKSAQLPQGSGAGLRIFIDPVTREIRPPTAEEIQALARQVTPLQVVPEPQMFTTRYGAIGFRVDPSFDSYMVAVKRPDGALDVDCFPNAGQATKALAAGAAPASVVPKKPALDEK